MGVSPPVLGPYMDLETESVVVRSEPLDRAAQAVALDSAGNIYVADTGLTKAIRKITPAGVVSTLFSGLAGSKFTPSRLTTIS